VPRLGLFDSFENHYYSRFPMTAEHNEFPPLEYAARRILESADTREENLIGNTWLRSFAAVVIREAMTQAGAWNLSFRGQSSDVLFASELRAIADNLHALPPEPPLKKQALDIWEQVEGKVSDGQARIMRTALALIPDPTP
jgi:hypothetical protein